MQSRRIDGYRDKMICSCGFTDYRTLTDTLRQVNPYTRRGLFPPTLQSDRDRVMVEQKRAHREHREIRALEEVGALVSSDLGLTEILARVAAKVARQLEADVCTIYVVEDDELVLRAVEGYDPSCIGKIRMKVGQGITGAAARDLRPVNLHQASLDPRCHVFPDSEERFHSMLAYPIVGGKRAFGVINVQCTSTRVLPEDELFFVSIITRLVLSAIVREQASPEGFLPDSPGYQEARP